MTSWRPTDHSEVLFLSSSSVFAPGTAIRGGIPVVFPWFGAGRSGHSSPAHGFARVSEWFPVSVEQHPDTVVVTCRLSGSGLAEDFPPAFTAWLRVGFGETLDVDLTVRNDDRAPFSFEEALHTYLVVGDVHTVRIDGLDGARYLDKVDGGQHQQHGPVVFDGETDRIYSSTAPVVLDDSGLRRRITVTKRASAQTVIWNPGVERAAAIKDLGHGEWTSFVCIEGANVLDDAVRLDPGEQHTMGYSLAIG